MTIEEDEEYRKKMLKQKEEFDEFKKKEGDSDLIFNEKDKEKKNLGFVLSKTRDMPDKES
ncbi:MAG TPA: hypothetical protein OQH54_06810 [Nitrosopumilus sp.]|nr:hypothetical protein [Thermoproteota archaeon]HJJ23407.1 hypothetical protein [Nitrosopumilus sp.]